MDESPKFSINFSNLLCHVLNDGIAKLHLIQAFPVDESEHASSEIGVCYSLIDTKTFLICKSIQGALNQEKYQKDSEKLIQLFCDVVTELKTSQMFKNLLQNVDESTAELLNSHFIMENFCRQKKAAWKLEGILEGQKEYDKQKQVDT